MSERMHEAVEDFRARARSFIRANLAPASSTDRVGPLRNQRSDEQELAAVAAGTGNPAHAL